jgi:hypothetical protein
MEGFALSDLHKPKDCNLHSDICVNRKSQLSGDSTAPVFSDLPEAGDINNILLPKALVYMFKYTTINKYITLIENTL